ncbi:MAG: AAA family ATPase, partial [Trueperaceae bacterium]
MIPFCGREEQLDALMACWQAVKDSREPRVAVLLAEAGLGKTRLAQEFYRRLVAAEQGSAGYWPQQLGEDGNNLLVNPPPAGLDSGAPMPFLWWGVRLAQQTERNQVATGALSAHVNDSLVAHLEPFHREQRRRRRLVDLAKVGGAVAADAVLDLIPFLGLVKKAGEVGLELKGIHDSWREDRRTLDAATLLEQRRDSLVDQLLADLGKLFSGPAGRTVPAVILVDDAQFSRADPGVTAFVRALIDAMSLGGWPVMLLVTHWEREYQDAVQGGDASPVASLVQEYAATAPDSVSLLRLPPILGLEPMVTSRLPGLTPEQLTRLTQRAGGNPQFLDEIVRLALDPRSRSWFEGRDTSAAMTESGLSTLLAKSVDLLEVAAARFAGSPEEVQKALVLAGLQGAEFLRGVVARMAQSLEPSGAPEHELEAALDAAASRHGYVAPLGLGQAAFRQRLYQEVAKEFLPAFYDEDEAVAELRAVVKDALHGNWDIELGEDGEPELWRLAVELFENSDDSEERRMAAQGLYRLSMFTSLKGELQVAHEQAVRLAALLDELPDDRLDPNLGWLRSVNDALAFMGDTAAQRPVLSRLLRLTGEAYEDDVNTWSASMYTEALLDVAEFYDRVGKSDLRQEALATAAAAMQSLDGFEPDVESLETALRLHREYGAYFEEQGQLSDARVLFAHALELVHQLSAIDDGPRRRFEAARMLSRIGANALYAGDTAAGHRDLGSAVNQLRELVDAFPGVTLEIHLVTALDDLAEARRREGDYRRAEEVLEEVLGVMRRHREMAPN